MPWTEVNDLRVFLQQLAVLPAIRNCPNCDVVPGHPHVRGCEIERCSACTRQRLSCNCNGAHDRFFARWTGFWPGELECISLGLLCKWQPDPQHPVPADTLCRTTGFDLNRFIESGWGKLFWKKPTQSAGPRPEHAITVLIDELLRRLALAGFELPDNVKTTPPEEKAGFLLDALVEVEMTPRVTT